MSHNPAAELAGTLQASHINFHPDPKYDANPSTSASKKIPVRLHRPSSSSSAAAGASDDTTAAADEIPASVLEAPPRKQNLPPLPDMRFEQSYLAKVSPYAEQGRYLMVAWVTVLDHVIMPFSQGVLWNILLHGWRAWNAAAKFQGQSVGSRVRRWWWQTNNWRLPEEE